MLKTKLGRAFMAITTVVLAAFATAVSANCTSMAQPLPSTYQTAAPAAGCGATMSMDCMLQMHGFDTYISSISSPSTLRINPLAHFAAPVPNCAHHAAARACLAAQSQPASAAC